MRIFSCFLAALLATGCGASRSSMHVTQAAPAPDAMHPTEAAPAPGAARPQETLSSFIEKTKELSARATPPPKPNGTTLESFDKALGAALVEAQVRPSGATARRVAQEYARNGVFDLAHQYLTNAVKNDPRDAANYEALARLWRDAHVPHLGMSDAQRAVYYAPEWAVAHNTLGTMFQALGRRAEARVEYERALVLDPDAAYVLNNLCYSDILDGRMASAIHACSDALVRDPEMRAARNNLGLAYAVAGRMDAAFDAFNLAVDPAGALYNLGVVRMARREYGNAVDAFKAAQAADPSFALAAARAKQARAQLGSGDQQ